MNDDTQFENRLRHQRVKPVPGEWRDDILREAKRAVKVQRLSPENSYSLLANLKSRLASVLWPVPRAWAGLAAVWVAILVMNFSAADKTAAAAMVGPPPSRETMQALKQQQRLLAELVERPELPKADSPRTNPLGPRSQRRLEAASV